MKDNKEYIKGVYEKYEEYKKLENIRKGNNVKEHSTNENSTKENNINENSTSGNNTKISKSKLIKVLSIAAVCTIVVSGAFVTNNLLKEHENKNQSGEDSKTTTSNKITLKTVDNFENFYKIVKENYADTSKDYFNSTEILDAAVQEENVEKSSTNSAIQDKEDNTDSYSKTNVQVENVDEADIVKTDGKYIYYVTQQKIVIVDIKEKEKLTKVSELNYENEHFTPLEIYINKDKLVVLGSENSYSYSNSQTVKETTNSIYKTGVYKQKTVAIVYDIANINSPKEIRRIEIEGRYISSRMIDNNIYFIGSKNINNYNLLKNEIEDLDEDIFKPEYMDTAKTTKSQLIDFKDIYYFENIENLNYLSLGGFCLDNENEACVKTFLGAGEDVYSSAENMYIVKSKQVYDISSYTYLGADTKILKFNLKDGNIEFKAEANVEGMINNQFSMDEKDGYFRIATTIGRTYNMDESTSNSLYILDDNLKEVSRLDEIAKGEKIYSVRYFGNRAYIVTFKEIDPLFVIDLSDPKNPKILGELKIPGYSTYLHPYDENHIIGFGYDTKTNSTGTGVQNNGLKMSMFDITDLNNPKEQFNIKIGNSTTSSLLTYNHKALLYSKEKNLIGFPITTYQNGKSVSKAQIYKIDLNNGFILQGEINHTDSNNSYLKSIERIIYSNDVFYTLSQKMIKATDMNSLKEITKLEL